MAAEIGVSAASVSRHWRAYGLDPHLVRVFKVSRDPKFVESLEDIVGLYMSPHEHALVMCCDEKSQVQALDFTQPGLAMKRAVMQPLLTTTSAAERPRCLPHSTYSMARSSPNASSVSVMSSG